eukprot:6214649-Pleurochrysis_carterae.AAC.5
MALAIAHISCFQKPNNDVCVRRCYCSLSHDDIRQKIEAGPGTGGATGKTLVDLAYARSIYVTSIDSRQLQDFRDSFVRGATPAPSKFRRCRR